MLEQLINLSENVNMKVLAMVKRFTSTILATSNVKLMLAIIIKFMVGIEWTHKNFNTHFVFVHIRIAHNL